MSEQGFSNCINLSVAGVDDYYRVELL